MPFNKAEVDARYEMTGKDQKIVHKTFTGKLSDAPLEIVEGMIARKSNMVKAKVPVTPTSPTKSAEK